LKLKLFAILTFFEETFLGNQLISESIRRGICDLMWWHITWHPWEHTS